MAKYILYLIVLCLTLGSAHPALCGVMENRGDIAATRAGVHRGFHRLVIELRRKAGYRIKKTETTLEIDVINVDSHGFGGGFAGTSFFRLKRISTISKDGKPHTIFSLALDGPARIRGKTFEKPYRIIVDMYPEKSKKHLVKKKKPVRKGVGNKVVSKKTTGNKSYGKSSHGALKKRAFAFNEGWRWIYRKMAVERLKESFYGNLPDHGLEMLREYIPVKGAEAWADGMEAGAYVKTLAKHGDAAGAATLKGIIILIKKEADPADVEREIIKTPENNFAPLARFLLASAYEREGLYPEAAAYYAMAYEAKTVKMLRARAALGRGRVLFFSGHVADSLKWFERAQQEGSKEAAGWLAGGRLVKGEFRSAWSGFRRLGPTQDPLALMGLGDMKMRRGDYGGAGLIFKGLKSRFRKDAFLGPFFAIREADAMLAAGLVKEGVSAYSSIKKSAHGEGLAMADMALADYYSFEVALPLKAKSLYGEVARSRTKGSGEAFIRLAEVLERLKEHGEAMKTLDKIAPENILTARRETAGFLRSKIAYNWIKDLYTEKKWLELAIVNYRYSGTITFGKRAVNYLRVGEALMRLGLTPDAVKALDRAVKIGSKDIKVKAVLLLARLYLEQRDGMAAGNLLEDLKASSPEVTRTHLWQDYYMEAQFLKGRFKDVIRLSRQRDDGRLVLMRAAAYRGLGMWDEAVKTYSRAIALFKKNKDRKGLMAAETGYGDSRFVSHEFSEAIEAYSSAAEMAAKVSTPTENWLHYRLSLSYAGAGMRDKAINAVRELKRSERSYGDWAEALQTAAVGGS